jgi:hypothetical protein
VTDTKEDKAKDTCEESRCRGILELGLGLVVNLGGLELAEKLIHGEGLIPRRLNDGNHLHIPYLSM